MKKTLLVALMGLMTIVTANAAVDFENITITLMNNTVVKYNASQLSDVTYVGGQFGEEGAVGIKLYPTGSTSSVDFLYSQILSIVYNEQTTTTFTRITSTGQLEAGKRYIIVCEEQSGAMGGIYNNNYRSIVTSGITLNNGTATVENESDVSIFTLGGSTSSWTFNDGSYYLANNSSSQLNSVTSATDNNAKWSIAFNGNNATITNKQNVSHKIFYNSGSNYSNFNASTSGTAVQLYVEDNGGSVFPTTVATPTFSPAGGTYSVAQTVTITTTTSGATIYYTTDGIIPTTNSTHYTAAITVNTTTTIKAIAVKDGVSSAVATATFTINSGSTTDNNVNANWNIPGMNIPKSKADPSFTNQSTDDYSWRLEFPHINTSSGNQRVVKATADYGITYSIEWDNNKIANRWTCYTMCSKNNADNTERQKGFKADPAVTTSPSNSYTQSSIYSRGHLCPSADRLCSEEQNKQTFFMTNMQPQYQDHNGSSCWATLEGYVRTKWQPINSTDTLYVIKAATIDNVTLNSSSISGVITTTTDGSGQILVVPKYFYMAFLYYTKYTNSYKAFALWTEQKQSNNEAPSSVITNRISIDELELRTGIDFFCNLPDDIESTVEATATYWDNSQ